MSPSIHHSSSPPHPGVYVDLNELVCLKFHTRGFSFLPRQVEPSSVQSPDATAAALASGRSWLWWTAGAVLLVTAAMMALWRKRRALLAIWKRGHMRRLPSEADLFAELLDACRASDARAAYNGLLRWLDARQRGPDTATIEAFLARHPNTDLRWQVELLQKSSLRPEAHWDGMALADDLCEARRQDLRRSSRAKGVELPDLNPC
jgi:hypothetical protein